MSDRPQPNRPGDNESLDINTTYSSKCMTIPVDDLTGLNVSIMRNGWPGWGLQNKDLQVLQGAGIEKDYINTIFSMITPYIFVTSVVTGSQDSAFSNEQYEEFDPLSQYTIAPFESRLFTNDDMLDSLLDTIPGDEVGFLSFGRNKMSIKGLTINLQEQTGLYSYKTFKFQFVIHRPDAFQEPFIQSLFSPANKFLIRWGYNINGTNPDLMSHAQKILGIIGAENKDTIQFTKWGVSQESNDGNIEVEAEAIPASNKSFITVKMGEHILQSQPDTVGNLSRYEEALAGLDNSEQPRTRDQDRLRQDIQNNINDITLDAFKRSVNRIPKKENLTVFSDVLNEISSCVNYSLQKNEQQSNSTFKFVCGRFNATIQPQPSDYIGDFTISYDDFKKFNAKIIQSKNIPHPMDYLDQFISEFLGDYVDFSRMSNIIKGVMERKQIQETILRKRPQESQKIVDASNELKKIDEELTKIMIPSMKFFNHEHLDEFNNTNFYCFVIDSSYGVPKIYGDAVKSAFTRVMESNIGISQEEMTNSENAAIPGSPQETTAAQPNNDTVFDIPIFNLFGENTILKDFSLDSETDDELQASLIKRMADKDLRGEGTTTGISFNDQFKFLTTKISFKTIGNNAFVPYQQLFFRIYGDIGVFSRLYNITGIEHIFTPGEWASSYETVMNAI
jgi:hypothetical protein